MPERLVMWPRWFIASTSLAYLCDTDAISAHGKEIQKRSLSHLHFKFPSSTYTSVKRRSWLRNEEITLERSLIITQLQPTRYASCALQFHLFHWPPCVIMGICSVIETIISLLSTFKNTTLVHIAHWNCFEYIGVVHDAVPMWLYCTLACLCETAHFGLIENKSRNWVYHTFVIQKESLILAWRTCVTKKALQMEITSSNWV